MDNKLSFLRHTIANHRRELFLILAMVLLGLSIVVWLSTLVPLGWLMVLLLTTAVLLTLLIQSTRQRTHQSLNLLRRQIETSSAFSHEAPWIDAPWEADRDWEMTTAAGMKFDELRAHFEATCQRSRDVVERAESLDALQKLEGSRGPTSLRWILIHMIEEYARHVGHADLIRESIDGQVGD
jgi:hypothetical protein